MEKEEFVKIKEDLKKYAESQGFQLNPDEKIVDGIISRLIKNRKLYKDYYCPCRWRKEEDNICPCKFHQHEIKTLGKCSCGLFVRK